MFRKLINKYKLMCHLFCWPISDREYTRLITRARSTAKRWIEREYRHVEDHVHQRILLEICSTRLIGSKLPIWNRFNIYLSTNSDVRPVQRLLTEFSGLTESYRTNTIKYWKVRFFKSMLTDSLSVAEQLEILQAIDKTPVLLIVPFIQEVFIDKLRKS